MTSMGYSEEMPVWITKYHPIELQKNHTDIWRVKISDQLNNLTYFKSILNHDEINVASKYHFSKNIQCSIVSRACLKILLGNYLRCHPSLITLRKNKYGKLFVSKQSNFFFNVTHTDEIILYAFAMTPIGIDIENTKHNIEFLEIAKIFFSEGEIKKLEKVSEDDLRSTFFRIWTRKEAFIKAIGKGLSLSLNQFEVTALTEEPACILSIHQKTKHDWFLQSFVPETGYQAAFVQKHLIEKVNYFSLSSK